LKSVTKNVNKLLLLFLAAWLSGAAATREALAQKPAASGCQSPVVVTGAVRTPSRFELRRRVRLSELLTLAGELTAQAGDSVVLTHPEPGPGCDDSASSKPGPPRADETYKLADVLRGDEQADPYLRPGDVIMVREVERVRVNGSVRKRGAVRFVEAPTLTRAVATAGGVLPGSEKKRITITRYQAGGSSKTHLDVDLKAIEKGRAADLPLLPNDIVYVPGKKSIAGCWGGYHVLIVTLSVDDLPLRVVE
jgi:protein involved in polysaccharide export with SLBB domain